MIVASGLPVQLINGLSSGAILLLMALGLSLVFGLGRVVNFSHGAVFALSALIGFTIIDETGREGYWLALFLTPIIVGAGAALFELLLIKRIRQRDELDSLLMTYGVGLVIVGFMRLGWGTDGHLVRPPALLDGSVPLPLLDTDYPLYRLFVLVLATLLAGALMLFVRRSIWGVRVRASVDNPTTAELLGTDSNKLLMSVFVIGAALAAIAGILSAPILSASAHMGDDMMIEAFLAIVLGGLGSIRGTIVAAFFVGITRGLASTYVDEYVLFVLFAVVGFGIFLRPNGILNDGRLE